MTIQERINSLSTKTKWAAGLALVLLGAPLLYFVGYVLFGAAYAMAAAATAFIVGSAIANLLPVLSMKFANWKLQALKSEAHANPVETLQNQQREAEAQLRAEAQHISQFDAEIETFRQSLQTEVEKGFLEAADAGIPVLNNMERLLEYRRRAWKAAQAKVKERAKKVQLAESKWRVALAAQKVKKASGEQGDAVLKGILENIAFESVEREVSTSMADLRTALMVEEAPDSVQLSEAWSAPALEDKRGRQAELQRMLAAPRQHFDVDAAENAFAMKG